MHPIVHQVEKEPKSWYGDGGKDKQVTLRIRLCPVWGDGDSPLRSRFTVFREAGPWYSTKQRDRVETFDLDLQGCLESLEKG